jgi:hypothetical protein
MKTRTRRRPGTPQAGAALARAALLAGLWLCAAAGHAQTMLNYWPFNDADWSFTSTNWLSDWHGHPPVSYTNLVKVPGGGDGTSLLLDSTNAAWLQYRVVETNNSTNLTFSAGSVVLWVSPTWSGTNQGGAGAGVWGRVIEVGSYSTNTSYGWWSIYTDPDGANLYFSAQTNDGSQANYLSAPIAWNSNEWHMIGITYSSTGTCAYVDGLLVTNGPGVTYWPGPDVVTNGFFLGSDSAGNSQFHGMFDDLQTYDHPLSADEIADAYNFYSLAYFPQPRMLARVSPAPSSPTNLPVFRAITGPGFLHWESAASSCANSPYVWFTNVAATLTSTGTVNVAFTIAGGSNGWICDVFANALPAPVASDTNYGWAWMGQGTNCGRYSLSLSNSSAFLRLGTPIDSDNDGLTDAYELLISHSLPHQADSSGDGTPSSGDGMLDGWKVLWGLDPSTNHTAQSTERANFTYDPDGWLNILSGVRSEGVSLDPEGNVRTSQ